MPPEAALDFGWLSELETCTFARSVPSIAIGQASWVFAYVYVGFLGVSRTEGAVLHFATKIVAMRVTSTRILVTREGRRVRTLLETDSSQFIQLAQVRGRGDQHDLAVVLFLVSRRNGIHIVKWTVACEVLRGVERFRLLSGSKRMGMMRILMAVTLSACLVVAQPTNVFGQVEKATKWLQAEVGMDIRLYNDFDEKLSNVGVGVTYLLTDWLAIGAGGRLAKTSPMINVSATCFLNVKPGTQKTVPFVRIGASTTGRDGAGQAWFGETGLQYSFTKSIAASTCLYYASNFRYRSRHSSYSSVGTLLRLSLRLEDLR
jgi:hypothetical protein